MTDKPASCQLSAAENQRIFEDEIIPDLLSSGQRAEQPVVVFIGGQTGAGKTAITDLVVDSLGQRGGCVNANMDFYSPYHPDYAALVTQDETTASALIRPDTEKWWINAQHHAAASGVNVVVETAMRSRTEFEELIPAFRAHGYRVEVGVLAVPSALSRLGALSRYLHELSATDGRHGRWVDPAIHDECYWGVLRAAAAIDRTDLTDTVVAFRRDASTVYANHRDPDGNWIFPPRTPAAILEERNREWTPLEQARFDRDVGQLPVARIDDRTRAEITEIKRLAEPLRPTGLVRRPPPPGPPPMER